MSINTAGFSVGQQVRLTAPFYGKPFSWRQSLEYVPPPAFTTLPAGTVCVVGTRQKAGTLFGGATVLVKVDGRTWCVPASLLEVVPPNSLTNVSNAKESNQPQQPGKEPSGDSQGDRVG